MNKNQDTPLDTGQEQTQLCEILTRVKDIQSRAARTETRLMRLADEMEIDVTKKREAK